MTPRNLVVSGGPLHDFATSTAALVELASEVGVESVVPLDPTEALDRLADADGSWNVVTVNALLWQMPAERHAPLRDAWAFRLDDRAAEGLRRHVERGGGLLACHTAPISFDAHPAWRDLIGASWDWDRSHHPPAGPAAVERTEAGAVHPITSGVADFATVDEVYAQLDLDPEVDPLLTSAVDGVDEPVLWARTVGAGRVVVDLLGHDARSYAAAAHAEVVRRAVRWLAREESP